MTTDHVRDTSTATAAATSAAAGPFADSRPTTADPVVFLIAGVALAALISTGLVALADPALGLLG